MPLQSNSGHHPTTWLPIPKTMAIINSQDQDLLGNQILSKSEDFCILAAILKMATIANQNGLHMVQHVLLPVNIHFHWNLFIFEFLTIYFDFILAAILKWRPFSKIFKTKTLRVIIYFCVNFQKDPLYGLNLTFFAPWLPWQRPPFWICSTRQKLPHTTVDIPTKLHEVWWKESKIFLNPLFFVSMATAAKFVQPIPICFTYLVPLDVDVVPTKFHQFLFGE